MKTAVVILNYNTRDYLRTFLPGLLASCRGRDAQLIVADNGSEDGSVQLMQTEFPDVPLIVLERNYGFTGGYNRALKGLEAEYYVLINSDIEVPPDWLDPLVDWMDSHPRCGACGPKLLSFERRDRFEYAGASGGYLDRFGYPFCRGRIFDTVEGDNGQYDDVADILWATGAALLIRSTDYWAVNGLDARFFAHNEEIDMCWRLRIRGRRIVCIPDSYVYHVGGGTLPKGNPMKTFLNFRNNLTMLYKCLPDDELQHVMRWRWFLDYLAAWETLILGRNWGDFKAIYRARRAFKRWKKDFEADRQTIQASRQIQKIPEQKSFSLLWQYYAKGRKLFSALPL